MPAGYLAITMPLAGKPRRAWQRRSHRGGGSDKSVENVSNLKRAASHPVQARCICSGVVVRVALQGAKVGERDMTADAVVCTGIEEGWVVLLADLAELAGQRVWNTQPDGCAAALAWISAQASPVCATGGTVSNRSSTR